MIIGDLKGAANERYLVHPVVNRALDYLRKTDLAAMEPGRYDIEGDGIYCLLQEACTGPAREKRPEAHGRYLDIQYLIRGRERIGTARLSDKYKVTENLMEEKDIVFYSSDMTDEMDIILEEGMFALFTPQDIHRPCCEAGVAMTIRKAVVKIDSRLLD